MKITFADCRVQFVTQFVILCCRIFEILILRAQFNSLQTVNVITLLHEIFVTRLFRNFEVGLFRDT